MTSTGADGGRSRPPGVRVVYYTDAQGWGGAEQVLATVLAGLPSEVSASVLGSDHDVCHRIAATRPGTEVVVVPRRHRLSPWTWLTLRSALARLRPDVVHVNSTWPLSSVEMLFALQLLRSPVAVAHEHLPMPMASSLHRLLKRLLSRRLDAHVVVGERAGQELAAYTGLSADAFTVVPNGVLPYAGPPAERVTAGPTVLGMGRFTPQKAFDVLVEAVAALPYATLLLVGARDRGEEAAAEADAEAHGLPRVRLHVRPWESEPRRWFGAADVFVLSSRFEAAPLVILEALASGTPVVATDAGSAREVLTQLDPRLVVPVDDAAALAGAIERVIDDPELAADLGRRGQALVERRYSAHAMATSFSELYRRLLERRRAEMVR